MVDSNDLSSKVVPKVWHTPTVELDRALYGVSDEDYRRLCGNLISDPYLGTSSEGVLFEYEFAGLLVTYSINIEPTGILVLIIGIRPPGEANSSRDPVQRIKDIVEAFEIFSKIRKALSGKE